MSSAFERKCFRVSRTIGRPLPTQTVRYQIRSEAMTILLNSRDWDLPVHGC